ncbi:zinc finger, CCHC-type containing protein [Tanacetum coccineum]
MYHIYPHDDTPTVMWKSDLAAGLTDTSGAVVNGVVSRRTTAVKMMMRRRMMVVTGEDKLYVHISQTGIRRSGRFKGKGPVIEENTIDEAIDVDEYLSEEEGSEYSIEDQDDNGDAGASTSGTKKLKDEKYGKITKKVIWITQLVEGIPSKLGFYVVNNFDQNTMEIKLDNGSLLITMEMITDMLGIINKGVDIWAENVVKDAVMTKNWLDQFGDIKNINQNHVKHVIRNSRIADINFKLNFIVLFTSMMYVDGTICKDFRVGRKRPPTTMWTKELLKERELAEIKAGGLRKGELEGPYLKAVVNADKADKPESGEEKRLAKILFKKMARDVSDVLFETKYGHQSSRGQIETLGPQEPVDDNILSSWSAYLNFLEEKKDSMSQARLFFPTLKVVFIPVSNGEHKFLVCVNLKNPAVTLIDSKKEGNKVTRKKKKDGNIDDVIVASKLNCQVSALGSGNFSWQTNRTEKDCRIFLMRHMECYMGNDIGKWVCGLDVKGKKQNA